MNIIKEIIMSTVLGGIVIFVGVLFGFTIIDFLSNGITSFLGVVGLIFVTVVAIVLFFVVGYTIRTLH